MMLHINGITLSAEEVVVANMGDGEYEKSITPIDVGIIVALPEEFREFRELLSDPQSVRDPATGISDYLFDRPVTTGPAFHCAATLIGDMGSDASLATERFLHRQHPETLVMLGIAAGIDGYIKLGDVVVATHVGRYLERAKIEPGQANTFDIRPGGDSYPCNVPLATTAMNLEFSTDGLYAEWQSSSAAELATLAPQVGRRKKLIKKGWLNERPQLVTGQIASGPVVAAAQEFVKWVLSVNRKYIALEMEAGAMLSAVYSSGLPARSLVLRGVSDFGDQRKAELDQVGSGGLRKYAMRNTVRLLWSLLESGAVPRAERSSRPHTASHRDAPLQISHDAGPGAPAPSPRAAIPHELPPAADEFFGREVELKRLTERLLARKNTAVVGPAGLGKTALAAKAVRAVVGEAPDALAQSPFPEGVVFLDLYAMHAVAEQAWNSLANSLAGASFMERAPAHDRAVEACRARRLLIVIEGGEGADGKDGRATIGEILSVLSPANRRLLLTRDKGQTSTAESVELKESLNRDDAGRLLDSLMNPPLAPGVRERILELLEGHPLALTWAGNLLARGDDDPARMVDDWTAEQLPNLCDPIEADRTLEWLFNRSVQGLEETAKRVLTAAALLAHAPFPFSAVEAAFGEQERTEKKAARDALRSLTQRSLLRFPGEVDLWQFSHVLGYRFARKETASDPAVRLRLANWLRGHIDGSLTDPAADLTLSRALEHLVALLRTDDDQSLWLPLASPALYETTDRLTDLGRLASVTTTLSAVEGWMQRIPHQKAQTPKWQREQSVLLTRQGDVLVAQGDLAGALLAYRSSLTLDRRLAESDPLNASWQHDLSISHNRMGDVLSDQGDLDGALASHREALSVIRRLAESDSNATWQPQLSVSEIKIGDVLSAQGDLAGALAAYRESLVVIQRLAESDPLNASWHRYLSISQSKIGDVLREQGDLAGALDAYREVLAVHRRLAASDPLNASFQHDLSIGHDRLGNALSSLGNLEAALATYREGLAVWRRLAESDPSNASWQRGLSFSLTRIAQIMLEHGDRNEAIAFAEEGLKIDERLAALDPTNATWKKDVVVSRRLLALLRT